MPLHDSRSPRGQRMNGRVPRRHKIRFSSFLFSAGGSGGKAGANFNRRVGKSDSTQHEFGRISNMAKTTAGFEHDEAHDEDKNPSVGTELGLHDYVNAGADEANYVLPDSDDDIEHVRGKCAPQCNIYLYTT